MTHAPAAAGVPAAGDPAQSRAARRLSKPGGPRFPMLCVLWRHHGLALTESLSFFVIAAGALVFTGPRLREAASSLGARNWREAAVPYFGFGPRYPDLVMQALPLLIALFVGVQLASREAESGTAAFAWTQGYSKTRWLLGKLAAAAVVTVPPAAGLGLVFGWWYQVYVPATGYFSQHAFALYAPALAGWTLAGLTLGTAAGTVTRREGRGMWLTLAGWAILHRFATLGSPATPASEFWPLQFAQLAILAALSALFTGVTIWLARDAPPLPGRQLLLRSLPWQPRDRAQRLARTLPGGRPRLAVARAAWRQHRTGLLAAMGTLAVFAVILLVTGLHIHAEPAQLRPRFAATTNTSEPGSATNGNLYLPMLLPFLLGAFLGGAVTARDLGRGTAAFAWTQGISRTRWITSKLITAGLVLTAAAAVASLVFAWWDQPYIAARITDPAFSLYPPVFAASALASFTVAAFLGALTRNQAAATVISLVLTGAAAAWNAHYLRPHYLPPALAVNRPAPANAYFINWYPGKPDGQPLTGAAASKAWHVMGSGSWNHITQALGQLHAASIQTYVAVSRFWPYQAIETAGLLTIALLFGTATILTIQRRNA